MKTKITLQLGAETLRQARILAAEKGLSVNAMLVATIQELVRDHKRYVFARRRALARLRHVSNLGWIAPTSREEIHDR
jgi:hypothetical protein